MIRPLAETIFYRSPLKTCGDDTRYFMAEWDIKKTLGQCYGTGEEFVVDQEYYAALVETEEGFERRDYSVGYWQENQPAAYCYWKTRMADPDKKKQVFIDDEMLMVFFDRLADETAQEKINFRFVLTLILMRKRKLRYDAAEIKDEVEQWTLKVAGQNREVKVINPYLSEDQISELSSQMGQIMQMDFE